MQNYLRFKELPSIQRSLSLKSQSTPSIKYNTSTIKNPQLFLFKLPSINSKLSSSEVTDRNTKDKVQKLQQQIKQLRAQVKNTRLKAKQTLNNINFINQTLAVNQLGTIKEDLKKQIKGIQRFGSSLRSNHQQRTRTIRMDCGALWNQTEQIRQKLYELRIRTDNLQEAMGFESQG